MPCGRRSICLACRIFQLRTWPRSRHRMPCSIEPVALFQQCIWLGSFGVSWAYGGQLSWPVSAGLAMHSPPGSRQLQKGWAQGEWLSRKTAEYPPELCQAFASCIHRLVAGSSCSLTLQSATQLVPRKSFSQQPLAIHDGAGRSSCPDWSRPHSKDYLGPLRSVLLDFYAKKSAPQRLLVQRSLCSLLLRSLRHGLSSSRL